MPRPNISGTHIWNQRLASHHWMKRQQTSNLTRPGPRLRPMSKTIHIHLDMKRQQAPKPEAQEPSDNPPLSEHSRGDRQTPAIIYWWPKKWPKKSSLYEMDPSLKKRLKNPYNIARVAHLAWDPDCCCTHCWGSWQCWRGQRTCPPWSE